MPFFDFQYLLLGGAAFLAGLIDSIVGGGGLIQLPALLGAYPKIEVPILCGTNKFASLFGTLSAARRYAQSVRLPWRVILPSVMTAFVGSFLGTYVLTQLPSDFLRPLVLGLLIAIAIYTSIKKDFGQHFSESRTGPREQILAAGIGGLIGFYDGFFGPGTGTFLVFLMIKVFRFDFLTASATAKVINVGTNLAALLLLISQNKIIWPLAIVMAVCNVAGSLVGASLAIAKGSKFVRILFLCVVSLLIAKMALDLV